MNTMRPVAEIKRIIGKTNRPALQALMLQAGLRPPARGGYDATERYLGSRPRPEIERVLSLVRRLTGR